MAALAFLFAVFRSRPSPFYLMDEVEAALDDVNLTRFLALVHEFRDEAQLLIVSHQKRTMETGDALYGVTMAPGGSSQVVSQKVEKEHEPAWQGRADRHRRRHASSSSWWWPCLARSAAGSVDPVRSRRRGRGPPDRPPRAPPPTAAPPTKAPSRNRRPRRATAPAVAEPEPPSKPAPRSRQRSNRSSRPPRHLSQPSGQRARPVQRGRRCSAVGTDRRRHLGLARGGPHPRRRGRGHRRRAAGRPEGQGRGRRRSPAATSCSAALGDAVRDCSRRPRPATLRFDGRRASPTSG